MFNLRRSPFAATPDIPVTPYDKARAIWRDRERRLEWSQKFMGLVTLLSVTATLIMAYVTGQNIRTVRSYPYVIEVNTPGPPGQVRTVGLITDSKIPLSNPVKVVFIQRWIEDVRALPLDPYVVKMNLDRAWAYAAVRAQSVIKEHIASMSTNASFPSTDARRKIIRVTNMVTLPISEMTYQITWHEDMQNYLGKTEEVTHWGATVTLEQRPWNPNEPITKDVDANPMRMFIHDLNWAPIRQS